MATVKAYTDLEQSKKLAKILPLESADMHYNNASIKGINYVDEYRAELMDYNTAQKVLSKYLINPIFGIIPCWSLSALLGVLSKTAHSIDEDGSVGLGSYKNIEWGLCLTNTNVELFTANNPVDACYKMIIKLNELNLL